MEGATEVNPPVLSSPWAKIQPLADPMCLNDIMSEQLANDLQIKEEKTIEIYEEAVVPTESVLFPDEFAKTSDCDNDELIALMLQAQFDKEHDDMLKRTEKKYNGSSKVSLSFSNYRLTPDCRILNDSEDEDTNDEKPREWDSFVSSEKQFKEMPRCGYKKGGDGMVTKHDLPMSNRRNACRVMNFSPGIHTGDGGGFDMQLSNKVFNSLKAYSRHDESRRKRYHDKIEHATAQLGVDPRTRLILFKYLNQEILDQINGVLSTGKEAVIMHADGGSSCEKVVPKECAIKIFKTTLNEFKSREKYIEDDYRFKDRFSKQNPRKIIHLWAEKEMHNLNRMQRANIACPEVVALKQHVLIMSFIGEDNKPAPKLKDADLNLVDLSIAYEDCIATIKKLYCDAYLVHADLSEYNILWHQNKCWYIDVSQAVERSHPLAYEFLFRDCQNLCSFFIKRGISSVITPEKLFQDVTNIEFPADGLDSLRKMEDFKKTDKQMKFRKTENDNSFEYNWSLTEGQK